MSGSESNESVTPAGSFGVCVIRSLHVVRFTIGTMLNTVAVVAILSWLFVGLGRGAGGLVGHPPLFLVVAFPFLFASLATLVVTLVQSRRASRKETQLALTDGGLLLPERTRAADGPARERNLKETVLMVAVWFSGLCVSAAAAGFFLAGQRPEFASPAFCTTLETESPPDVADLNLGIAAPAPDAEEGVAEEDIPVQRTSRRAPETKSLPFPHLPTRYSPGPLPESVQSTAVEQREALPMPRVPSKAPPGPMPDVARGEANPVGEIESSAPH
jgi:hypothetical protein